MTLLGVLADLVLDAGTPSICNPYLTSLFQNAVQGELAAQPHDTTLLVSYLHEFLAFLNIVLEASAPHAYCTHFLFASGNTI